MGASDRPQVLEVEDDYLQAQALAVALAGGGFEVVGPAGSVDGALALVDPALRAAILDIHVGKEVVTPVAEELEAVNVPFAFVTAYSDVSFLPGGLGDRKILRKPVERPVLLETVRKLAGIDGGEGAEESHSEVRPADPAEVPRSRQKDSRG